MELFLNHIKKNILLREGSRRIFHGRGRSVLGFEHINIDYFSPYIIIVLYKETSADLITEIKTNLLQLFTEKILGIAVQSRFLPKAPLSIIWGDIPSEHVCEIENCKYHLKLGHAQNMGFFLDMEEGRKYLATHSRDKRILNLFSYTCALSVVALKNGALKVVNFDMSKAAIKRGVLNHQLNQIESSRVRFFDHDIFKSWAKVKREGPYDMVIIDPPSDHGEHFNVEKDYAKIIKRIPEWLNTGGIVISCLNSPHLNFQFLESLVRENCSNLELIEKLNFPIHFNETDPDSGLKILIWKYI